MSALTVLSGSVILQLGAVFIVYVVNINHVEAMICVPTDRREQGNCSDSDIYDQGCTVEKEGHGRLL